MQLRATKAGTAVAKEKKKRRKIDSNQIILQVIAVAGIAWYLLFIYVPYIGLTIAFRDFRLTDSLFGGQWTWVGIRYFQEMWNDIQMPRVIRNTVIISILKLLTGLPAAILFALLLNEIPRHRFKRFAQTVSYFPHFIPWIIVSLMMLYFFSPQFGMFNTLFMGLGLIDRPMTLLTDSGSFYWLAVWSELWKSLGWSSILFIAAVSGVDQSLYEAAVVDGATRWHKMFYITLPSIMGVVVLVFILQFSSLFAGLGGTFEQSMFLGNALNNDRAMVLGRYVLETGIGLGRFSYSTAVGMVTGLVGLALLGIGNVTCKKFLGRGLYTGGDNN
jgi:putative aldouronate transport system permease protein